MTSAPPVVVVGGGVAGLATAYELHRRGIPVRVFERAARAGGVVLTERVDGFTFDAGPDALLIQKPAAIQLCRELGLGDRLFTTSKPRTAFILRDGVLHPLPESSVLGIPRNVSALAATRLFSLAGKARMAMEILLRPRPAASGDESIASFIGRRFGAEAVTYLAEPLLAGIHAGDVNRLSMRALFPRFLEAERKHGSVLRAFRQLRQPASHDGAFMSLPGGLTEIVDALLRVLPAGTVSVGTGVQAVERGAAYGVVLASGERLEAGAVVLCTPSYVAASLVRGLDIDLARLCGGIPYASSATVTFGYRREAVAHPLRGSGFVVPKVEGTRIMAGSWISSKWRDRAPSGHVLLRAFIGGARDPGAVDLDDGELIRAAESEMGRLMGIQGPPIFTRLHRWERANAQHEVGHLDRIAAIDARLAARPGLFVTGSGFRGVGVPDCVADARATAAAVANYLDHEGHEGHEG
ncbi:MAG: protoporphyrinogen oxidase [Acidobacteria bacterium]|nr:MAG: protoporphyrinogen oxidase [Acidobacteriota bacterium]